MAGLFHHQHEPQILPNGNMLVYDNLVHSGAGECATRILEFDPRTQALVWKYTGTVEDSLESPFFGSQQRLANRSTLIVEATDGCVLEVTTDNHVVWQYRFTARPTHHGATYIQFINDMARFSPGTLNFLAEPQQYATIGLIPLIRRPRP